MTRILVDTSIRSAAQLGEWIEVPHTVEWGGRKFQIPWTGLAPKRPEGETRKAGEAVCLPTIGRLARQGRLTLATYDELQFEEMNGLRPVRDSVADALHSVPWLRLEPAIDRSYFVPTAFPPGYKTSMLDGFCRTLLSSEFDPRHLPAAIRDRLPEGTLRRFAELDEFRALCRDADGRHLPDLFHLWTGEVNDCDFFLTMDRRFINFCASHVRRPLKCRPIGPSSLLSELGIDHADPLFAEPDEVLDGIGRRHLRE